MNTEIKLPDYQKELLLKLSKASSLRFNDLLIDGLESEHMNYHLKKLLELKFVEKDENKYFLTDAGKHFVNSLDDVTSIVEKQPKVSVIIIGVRKNEESGEIQFLLSRRREQPYLGKVGRIGGKVRFGEQLEAAARRELLEETGLTAEKMTLERIYRKMRKRPSGEFVQDVIFHIFLATGFSGELITETPYQDNFWASNRELKENPDRYDLYDDLVLEERLEPVNLTIEERVNIADGY